MSHDAVNAATKDRPRLLSLDAFRGLTILAMILVNNPGSWADGERYAPLDHAEWHGWTPTDLIFPFFLFIVGTSLAYSLRKYRELGGATPELYARIIRRTCTLFLLGVGMALFGHACDRCFGEADSLELDTLRYLGVLQRIALVYFATSLIALKVGVRGQAVIAILILLGYWMAMSWHPSDDVANNLSREGNVVRQIDLKVIGAPHMYTQATSEPTEPEGLLSTFPSIVTALLGYWTGLLIQRSTTQTPASRGVPAPGPPGAPSLSTVALLIACGLAVAALGLLWDQAFPINKKLWTSSFVLLTGGLAMVGLAVCLAVFDVAGYRSLARPFEIVGVNAITIYVGAGLMGRLLEATHIGTLTTHQWIYKHAFTDHIANPKLASLGFAAAMVACWWLIAWAMARRGWTWRV
jgi:predicted acyltransferase